MKDLNKKVVRHTAKERLLHWFVVICFLFAGLSGLGFFFAPVSWLTRVFGTPQLARILHPFVGVVMFVGFILLFLIAVKNLLPEKGDGEWLKNIISVLAGKDSKLDNIGRFNAGQKLIVWFFLLMLLCLVISGVIMWQPYFANSFTVPVRRIAIFIHSFSGFGLILAVIGHGYMGFWVKGSIDSMIDGKVTARWARKHHPKWYREDIEPKIKKEQNNRPEKENL